MDYYQVWLLLDDKDAAELKAKGVVRVHGYGRNHYASLTKPTGAGQ